MAKITSSTILSADPAAKSSQDFYYPNINEKILHAIDMQPIDGMQRRNLIRKLEELMAQEERSKSELAIALFFFIRQLEQKESAEKILKVYFEINEKEKQLAFLLAGLKELERLYDQLDREIKFLEQEIQRLNLEYKAGQEELTNIVAQIFEETLPAEMKGTPEAQRMKKEFVDLYTSELVALKTKPKESRPTHQAILSRVSAKVLEGNLDPQRAMICKNLFIKNIEGNPVVQHKVVELYKKADSINEIENMQQIKLEQQSSVLDKMKKFKKEIDQFNITSTVDLTTTEKPTPASRSGRSKIITLETLQDISTHNHNHTQNTAGIAKLLKEVQSSQSSTINEAKPSNQRPEGVAMNEDMEPGSPRPEGVMMNEDMKSGNQRPEGVTMNEDIEPGNHRPEGVMMNEDMEPGSPRPEGVTRSEDIEPGNQRPEGVTMNEDIEPGNPRPEDITMNEDSSLLVDFSQFQEKQPGEEEQQNDEERSVNRPR